MMRQLWEQCATPKSITLIKIKTILKPSRWPFSSFFEISFLCLAFAFFVCVCMSRDLQKISSQNLYKPIENPHSYESFP